MDIDEDVVDIAKEDTLSITTANRRKADKEDDGIAIVIGCRIGWVRRGKSQAIRRRGGIKFIPLTALVSF